MLCLGIFLERRISRVVFLADIIFPAIYKIVTEKLWQNGGYKVVSKKILWLIMANLAMMCQYFLYITMI